MAISDAVFLLALLFFLAIGGLAQVIAFLITWLGLTWFFSWVLRKYLAPPNTQWVPLPGWLWFLFSATSFYPAFAVASIVP